MTKKLLSLLPEHRIYVEAFGGGASLLFAKRPSPVEVYNDIDGNLVDFFRVLANPRLFKKFYRRVMVLPYSRSLYNECREDWREQEDLVERAWRWFVVVRQGFGGVFGKSWGFARTESSRGMAGGCSRWLSIIDLLPEIHGKLQRVQIECRDFEFILNTYDSPETLFYLDPPYVTETRRDGGYSYEMTDEDHKRLVDILLSIKGQALLSGYDHEIYSRLTGAGWERFGYQTACYAAARTRHTDILGEGTSRRMQPRTEIVWRKTNGFSKQLQLFK